MKSVSDFRLILFIRLFCAATMSQIYEPRFSFRIKQMNLSVENSNLFSLSEFPMVDYYIETLDELKGIIDLFSTCS